MNRLKNLVNNDQGKTLNTAEQRFARIQGLVVLFGETKRYCDQNEKLYSNNTNDMIDKHGKEKIDTLVALNNATQLFKRITKNDNYNADFEISQNKSDSKFSSLTSSLSDPNFLKNFFDVATKENKKIRKDFSFNINTIKKLEHDNNNKHKIARVTKLNSTNGGAINTTRQIKSSRLPAKPLNHAVSSNFSPEFMYANKSNHNNNNNNTNRYLSNANNVIRHDRNNNDYNNRGKGRIINSINHQSSPSVNYQQEKEQVSGFTTARDKDIMDKLAKRKNLYGSNANNNRKNNGGYNNFNNNSYNNGVSNNNNNYGKWNNNNNNNSNNSKKTLGLKRRPGFQPPRPLGNNGTNSNTSRNVRSRKNGGWNAGTQGAIRAAASNMNNNNGMNVEEEEIHPRLKCLDPALVEQIENEILKSSKNVKWNDIAGLEFAKRTCQEIVVMPILCPEMFQGLRKLPKGLLLFGPPGTGKTMIGKAIASQTGATFFSISASSLTSKWIGQGEKLVRALFGVAAARQPSVIFIDEIDSLLTQRASGENEASRRIKTEFLIQLDGAGSSEDEKILVLGATNRPQELDEAARRRFMKRLYIPLPNAVAREALLKRLLTQNANELTEADYTELVQLTKGYSGSDLDGLCREAAMVPLRDATQGKDFLNGSVAGFSLKPSDLRPIVKQDLFYAMRQVRASVGKNELEDYKKWNTEFGSFEIEEQT